MKKGNGVRINENERKVLEVLEANTRRDGEMCISFSYIEGETKLGLKTIRKACRSLARRGLAQFFRGLMTEDSEVAGSGYCISYDGELFLKPCIDCTTSIADMNDGRCNECWNGRACLKCGKAYRDHALVNGYRQEFEFTEPRQIQIAL